MADANGIRRSELEKFGVCAVSPVTNTYNYVGPSIVGNAQGLGELATSAGDGMAEPLRSTVNGLGYLGYGVGAVWGAIKGLFIGTTGAYIVSSAADGSKWGTGGEACVSLADGLSNASFDELKRRESEGWLK